MRQRTTRLCVALLVAAATIGSAGCYGPFKLTKKLHSWNGQVSENAWVNELVFLGLMMVPAYPICTFGDAIVVNSIEFWTGSNPMDEPQASNTNVESNDGRAEVALQQTE